MEDTETESESEDKVNKYGESDLEEFENKAQASGKALKPFDLLKAYELAVSRMKASLDEKIRKSRMTSAINLCRTYVNDGRTSVETKEKVGNILAILEGTEFNQRDKEEVLSPDGLDTISEADPPSGCGDEMAHVIHTVQPSAPPIAGTSGSAEEWDKVPLPCIAASTPSKTSKGHLGVIADYTPNTHPMVPALIQHCVNEIEISGLTHEGLYSVCGLEREIKELKDHFLRGKGVPNLSIYDPHVICGCIKDFLRSLREPLVGRHFWRDFALATDISDPMKRQIEINRALEGLPPPNRDTLAFLVLHLQRIAEIEVVKMPLSNMAKVFGPSLIGYSVGEIDANNFLQETKKQQLILITLLSMSSEYWTKFLKRSEPIPLVEVNSGPTTRQRTSRFSSVGRARGGTLTNSTSSQVQALAPIQAANNKTSSKKIYFHDVSPQRSQTNARPKKNYFD